MIISQVSISPVGEGASLSKYVKLAVQSLKKQNLKMETNAMATVIETEDLDTLLDAIKVAHNALVDAGAKRIITEIKIDDRRDKDATAKSKIKAVK